jgi:cyclophilin family peptidyl-prolyl cis-trans isomerase
MLKTGLFLALVASLGAAKADFRVQFDVETTAGEESFTLLIHEDWAPIGAARFKELVEEKFYDDVRFFRVIPSFMVQFGLSGKPDLNSHWRAKTIKDEPVKVSNKPGYITFAKTGAPNSRTTQLFINYVDNARLDSMGFAPFGEVEGNGMEVVKRIYNCGEKPNQGQIQSQGNSYLDSSFPSLSKIKQVRLLAAKEEM